MKILVYLDHPVFDNCVVNLRGRWVYSILSILKIYNDIKERGGPDQATMDMEQDGREMMAPPVSDYFSKEAD